MSLTLAKCSTKPLFQSICIPPSGVQYLCIPSPLLQCFQTPPPVTIICALSWSRRVSTPNGVLVGILEGTVTPAFIKFWPLLDSPVRKTYRANEFMRTVGHVGGVVLPGSFFSRSVNSNPNPDKFPPLLLKKKEFNISPHPLE